MPNCKNNFKKTYTGNEPNGKLKLNQKTPSFNEPSPKGLGYCASGEKEGTVMKGKDGNMWIKKNSKDTYYKKIFDKLYKWWLPLSQGNIIIIYTSLTSKGIKETKNKLIKSNMKTRHAQNKDIIEKWNEFDKKSDVKAIIWSAQSIDAIQFFIEFLLKKMTIKQLEAFLTIKNLPEYILENYKKYFEKNKLYSNKDYYLKNLII
jgi:hypothetical protein